MKVTQEPINTPSFIPSWSNFENFIKNEQSDGFEEEKNAGENFLNWFVELYGQGNLPEMESGDWKAVSEKCNFEEKPLLLYVNSKNDPNVDSDVVLCNDLFHNFITSNNMIVFGLSAE